MDDQEPNLLLLHELVSALDYDSDQARDGIEALKLVEKTLPDLILLDIMMPEMDGEQVLQHLMADKRYRHIPVIMVSAVDDIERVATCISLGAADYLVKPFNMRLLKARIQSCLEKKRLHDKDTLQQSQIREANEKIKEQYKAITQQNATLQEEIRKRSCAERDLRSAQRMALRNAHATGMAEIASSVLHNIGNTLNSVNTSCHQLWEILSHNCHPKFSLANQLLLSSIKELAIEDEEKRAKLNNLVTYYHTLADNMGLENERLSHEIDSLLERVEIIKNIIQAQRNISSGRAFTEAVDLKRVVDDVLRLQEESLNTYQVSVETRITAAKMVSGQKTKISHILLNLIINARESMESSHNPRYIRIEVGDHGPDEVVMTVSDTGEGIPAESLKKIFHHGFTTRSESEGFGLHATAIAISEMDGRIIALSDGPGLGATFKIFFKVYKSPEELSGQGNEAIMNVNPSNGGD